MISISLVFSLLFSLTWVAGSTWKLVSRYVLVRDRWTVEEETASATQRNGKAVVIQTAITNVSERYSRACVRLLVIGLVLKYPLCGGRRRSSLLLHTCVVVVLPAHVLSCDSRLSLTVTSLVPPLSRVAIILSLIPHPTLPADPGRPATKIAITGRRRSQPANIIVWWDLFKPINKDSTRRFRRRVNFSEFMFVGQVLLAVLHR